MSQTTDIGEIFRLVARDLGEQITAEVMPQVKREIAQFAAENAQLCWSEEAAAAQLQISEQKLASLAKAGSIGFSYTIEPTQWGEDGKALNGRRVYMRQHLINYLLHREVKGVTATAFDTTAGEVYQLADASQTADKKRGLKAA